MYLPIQMKKREFCYLKSQPRRVTQSRNFEEDRCWFVHRLSLSFAYHFPFHIHLPTHPRTHLYVYIYYLTALITHLPVHPSPTSGATSGPPCTDACRGAQGSLPPLRSWVFRGHLLCLPLYFYVSISALDFCFTVTLGFTENILQMKQSFSCWISSKLKALF